MTQALPKSLVKQMSKILKEYDFAQVLECMVAEADQRADALRAEQETRKRGNAYYQTAGKLVHAAEVARLGEV